MSVYDVVLRRRSIRCFKKKRILFSILEKLVNAARFAPSAANLQPCEFIVVDKKETVEEIFPTLRWAGYIRPKGNPPKGKEPTAYIIILINPALAQPLHARAGLARRVGVNRRKRPLNAEADAAAAIENILLVAEDVGLGSCWLGAIDKTKIRKILKVPKYCEVKYVLALGYADQRPKVERLSNSVKYWKDKRGLLHVPKRSLNEVLHRNRY